MNKHALIQIKDRLPFVVIKDAKIHIINSNVVYTPNGETKAISVPANQVSAMLLGPRTSITHEAIKILSSYHVQVQWVGDSIADMFNYTHIVDQSSNLERHNRLFYKFRLPVANKIHIKKFGGGAFDSMEAIRGAEGRKVKELYIDCAKRHNVRWDGRIYSKNGGADVVNDLISIGNHHIYSVCLSSIVAMGYSPHMGFLHNTKSVGFVYDIADIYKIKYFIPYAFEAASTDGDQAQILINRIDGLIFNGGLMEEIASDISEIMNYDYDDC